MVIPIFGLKRNSWKKYDKVYDGDCDALKIPVLDDDIG